MVWLQWKYSINYRKKDEKVGIELIERKESFSARLMFVIREIKVQIEANSKTQRISHLFGDANQNDHNLWHLKANRKVLKNVIIVGS